MQLRKAERRQAKIKLAIQGASGSGKSMSALLLAYGLVNDWSKVVIIDTENRSADLYAHLGDYNVLNLSPPYSPEKYIKAIEVCERSNMEVIIIDSISHCWEFLLDCHSRMTGNSFSNWRKITPRQKRFMDRILQSDRHIIATLRTKQDYVLNKKDGKYIPEKVGLKAIQRDGVDYEFTIVFDINLRHLSTASKDRTSLFTGIKEFSITTETGKAILDWCNAGTTVEDVKKQIQQAKSVEDLNNLYRQHPDLYESLETEFKKKKQSLTKQQLKAKSNGITSH